MLTNDKYKQIHGGHEKMLTINMISFNYEVLCFCIIRLIKNDTFMQILTII